MKKEETTQDVFTSVAELLQCELSSDEIEAVSGGEPKLQSGAVICSNGGCGIGSDMIYQ